MNEPTLSGIRHKTTGHSAKATAAYARAAKAVAIAKRKHRYDSVHNCHSTHYCGSYCHSYCPPDS